MCFIEYYSKLLRIVTVKSLNVNNKGISCSIFSVVRVSEFAEKEERAMKFDYRVTSVSQAFSRDVTIADEMQKFKPGQSQTRIKQSRYVCKISCDKRTY